MERLNNFEKCFPGVERLNDLENISRCREIEYFRKAFPGVERLDILEKCFPGVERLNNSKMYFLGVLRCREIQ